VAELCLHIIGAGRAASALAAAWRTTGTVCIGQVLNRSRASASRAADLIGAGQPCADLRAFCHGLLHNNLPAVQHWLLLGTPDSAVTAAAQSLQQAWRACTDADMPLALAFHLSGQLGPAALGDRLDWPGTVQLAAAHPVVSFADPQRAQLQLAGSYCVLEAADAVHQRLSALFAKLGMQTLKATQGMDRASYHSALVMVSNCQCALHDIAEDLLQQAGFDPQQSRPLLGSLSSTVAANLAADGSLAALTGPLERGDAVASDRIFQACASLSTHKQLAAMALAAVVLDMAREKGSLSEQQLQQMLTLLNKVAGEPSS